MTITEAKMQFVPDDPIHPGEILRHDFLEEFDLTVEGTAIETGISVERLSAILAGRDTVTAEVALRLGRFFTTSPEFWLNLQRSYDLSLALKTADGLEKIRPVHAA